MPSRRAFHRPNRLPVAPPPRRHSVHSPAAPKSRESALEHVRRIAREQEKPFDPTKRGTWRGSSKDLVVNGHRKGDRHGQELIEGEESFVVIEQEPDDRNPYVLVNPLEYENRMRTQLFAMHFGAYGTTRLLLWADHLETALELAAEWLAQYAPGHISTEEHIGQLVKEVQEEEPGISDEDAYEKATADLTYTESGYLTSYEWTVDDIPKSSDLHKAALEASKEEYEAEYGEHAPNKRGALRRNSSSQSPKRLNKFQQGFLEAALWSSTDNADDSGGEPLDKNYGISDIAPETLASLLKDCDDFCEENADLLAQAGDDEQNGHDFWLTRNGHGAGFWDRGYGAVGDKLSAACKAYGGVDLYVGDDGQIYGS
jgi:hypothetical protein